MAELTVFSLWDIERNGPCYDPERYLSPEWEGTIVDIFKVKECPLLDRAWVITNDGLTPENVRRKIVKWLAGYMRSLKPGNPDYEDLIEEKAYECERRLALFSFFTENSLYHMFDALNDLKNYEIAIDEDAIAAAVILIVEEDSREEE